MMIPRVSPLFSLILLLTLWTLPASGSDRLIASVDRDRVAFNETLELVVEWHGSARNQPDFSALEHQFDILGIRQSSQTSMSGTNFTSITRWHLMLLPKETGTLVIPSLHFNGAISEALPVAVTEADNSARTGQRFWLDSSVDRQQAHIGEQILVTYRLHYASPLRQMSRSDLAMDDAEVLLLQERQFQMVIDDVHFQVAELRFAVFASRAGMLEIPPLRLEGYSSENGDPRFGSFLRGLGNPVRLGSEAHQVEILPRPAEAGRGTWLPARGVSLSEQWSQPDQPLRVGEPVTRSVRIDAQGVKAQQLPELDFGEPDGYRLYPEAPRLQHREDEKGLLASRIESHALIASRPGLLTLPPVRVQWWDTEANRLRETVLASRTVKVLPAADSTDHSPQPDADTPERVTGDGTSPAWLYLSLLANLLMLLILVYGAMRRSRRQATDRHTAPPSGRTARHQLERRLQRLAADNDGRAFRHALLEWAQAQWPDEAPATLEALAVLAQQAPLGPLLRKLDAALYDHGTQPSPELTAAILAELKAVPTTPKANAPATFLPSLYS